MGIETERKYLLWEEGTDYTTENFRQDHSWDELSDLLATNSAHLEQGYLPVALAIRYAERFNLKYDFEPTEARIRSITRPGQQPEYWFTLKGKGTLERPEEERRITSQQYSQLWGITEGARIIKKRGRIMWFGLRTTIDWYLDRDLVVAEIEVKEPEEVARLKAIELLGHDVTEEKQYKNRNLAR